MDIVVKGLWANKTAVYDRAARLSAHIQAFRPGEVSWETAVSDISGRLPERPSDHNPIAVLHYRDNFH